MPTGDPQNTNAVLNALMAAGGGTVLTLLGALLTGLLKGTVPQEKELRDDLAAQVRELRGEVKSLKDEQIALNAKVERLSRHNARLYRQREEARLRANLLEQKHAEAITAWPLDPEEEA